MSQVPEFNTWLEFHIEDPAFLDQEAHLDPDMELVCADYKQFRCLVALQNSPLNVQPLQVAFCSVYKRTPPGAAKHLAHVPRKALTHCRQEARNAKCGSKKSQGNPSIVDGIVEWLTQEGGEEACRSRSASPEDDKCADARWKLKGCARTIVIDPEVRTGVKPEVKQTDVTPQELPDLSQMLYPGLNVKRCGEAAPKDPILIPDSAEAKMATKAVPPKVH